MAVNLIYKVKIDTKDAVGGIKKIDETYVETLDTLEKLEIAQQNLNEEIKKVSIGSDEYKQLSSQLRQVNTELKNSDLAMEALDNEQLGTSIKSVAGGLTDIAGGLALIGVSGEGMEKVAETFAQVEGLSKVVGGAFDIWNDGLKLVKQAQNAAAASSAALTAAQVAQGAATKGAAVQQGILNAVMNANPVLLLVTGIGLLVGAFALFSSRSKEAEEQEKKRIAAAQKAKEVADSQRESIAKESTEFVGLIYQLKQTNVNSKERSKLIKEINDQYGTTLKNLSDETAFQEQLNGAVKDYIAYQTLKVRIQSQEEYMTNLIKKRIKAEQEHAKILKNLTDGYTKVSGSDYQYRSNMDGTIKTLGEFRDKHREYNSSLLEQESIMSNVDESLNAAGLSTLKLKEKISDITDSGKKYTEQTRENVKVTDEFSGALKELRDRVSDLNRVDVEDRAKTESEKLKLSKYTAESELKLLYENAIKKSKTDEQKLKAEESYNEGLRLISLKYNRDYQKYLDDQVAMYENAISEREAAEAAADKEAFDKNKEAADKEFELYIQNQRLKAGENIKLQKEVNDLEMLNRLASVKEGSEEETAIKEEYRLKNKELDEKALDDIRQKMTSMGLSISSIIDAGLTGDLFSMNDAFRQLMDTVNTFSNETFINLAEAFDSMDWEDKVAAITDAIVGITNIATEAINAMNQARFDKEQELREQSYAHEKELLDNQLAERALTQEEYDVKMRNLEDAKKRSEEAAKQKAFKQQKRLALINAIMNTAGAVVMALSTMGPPASYVMAGVNAALGAAQIAIISKQEYRAARGGIVPGVGSPQFDSVPALLAPGETVINSRSSSMFPNLLSEINQIGGGVELSPSGAIGIGGGSDTETVFRQNNVVEALVSSDKITKRQSDVDRARRNSRFE